MTHLLKLLVKMCKYEMDPTSIVEDTERTRFCPQTDRWTRWNPFQLHWSGEYKNYCHYVPIRSTLPNRSTTQRASKLSRNNSAPPYHVAITHYKHPHIEAPLVVSKCQALVIGTLWHLWNLFRFSWDQINNSDLQISFAYFKPTLI